MPNIIDNLRAARKKQEILPQGFQVYHTPPEAPQQFRLHLRREPDGNSVLIVNASSVLHLNQSATEMVSYLMEGMDDDQIAAKVIERFNAEEAQIRSDVKDFHTTLLDFIRKVDQDPEMDFGLSPLFEESPISAPYRLDCCLTDRISTETADTEVNELSTQGWKEIINNAFLAGIPHLVFFGGEPLLRDDLIELFKYCEEMGVVSGLISGSEKLADPAVVSALLDAGLDHLMVLHDPSNPKLTQALDLILPLDLYTCVHFDVDTETDYAPLLQDLAAKGANAFSFSPSSEVAYQHFLDLSDYVQESEQKLSNDLPMPVGHPAYHVPGLDEAINPTHLAVDPKGQVWTKLPKGILLGDWTQESWTDIWVRRPKLDE